MLTELSAQSRTTDTSCNEECSMTTKIAAALAMVALLAGCQKREDTGALREDSASVDTVVQSGTVKDTTVVQTDTNIDKDTVKKTDHIEDKKN